MGWFTLLVFFCLIVYSRRFRKALVYLAIIGVALLIVTAGALSIYDQEHYGEKVVDHTKSGVLIVPRSTDKGHDYL